EIRAMLLEQGTEGSQFFAKPQPNFGLCSHCVALALMTLQCHAPKGGSGHRVSLRGVGPITTLLIPHSDDAPLWERIWVNVIPTDELAYPLIAVLEDVFPWLAPTRTSDGPHGRATLPTDVHPLQAYWGMPQRIRLDWGSVVPGICDGCGIFRERLVRRYRRKKGGVNYQGPWIHPLSPCKFGEMREEPPHALKAKPGGMGYRDWLSL